MVQGLAERVLENGMPMPNIPEMSTVWTMDDAVDFIVQGEAPKSVLDETAEQIAAAPRSRLPAGKRRQPSAV